MTSVYKYHCFFVSLPVLHAGRDLCHNPYPVHKIIPYPSRMSSASHLIATAAFNEHFPLVHLESRSMAVPWETDGTLQEAERERCPCLQN